MGLSRGGPLRRSKPLVRRTRLEAKVEAQRAWRARGKQLRRSKPPDGVARGKQTVGLGPLEAVPRSPRKGKPGSSGRAQWDAAVLEVKARSGGLCEANWPGVCPDGPHRGEHRHHVLLRSQGGPDEAWNLLDLCLTVHRYAHDHPAEAVEHGVIRRRAAR